ncbi:bifunctional 3-(3-hydroxy-phenyl)propionate/3-hydroxycinnamic acid hydroxylase [Acuticoccus kandeliae]|uniref:bifunctional 3-(3-hydroxy-phenyl)propionate/3-hydroxycinnamic acid hydroxylase n=1 Tax=Acuticoccus kandeliae TaxID=2073160 RepID=UPI000D3EB5CB|nr:bifunctional 3-(3-hydroxy-phenyl)propionate/3-hydroxycinnamic acid hydroxylase [Acuticoccus kandeliae]
MLATDRPTPALDADIIVVGAGPTGLVLANLLGQRGVRTLLLERSATTVQEPRAVSIDDESMRTMQAIGVDDELMPLLARGYGSHYRGPDGAVFAIVEPNSTEFGFDKRNAFQQPELEGILGENLKRHASLDVRFNCNVVAVAQDETGASAIVEDRGGHTTLRGQYLVGSDGARSLVRKSLGINLTGSSFEQQWLIVDIFKTRNRFRHTEVFCNPRRPGITLPGPRGTRRYEFMLHPHETEACALQEDFVRTLLNEVGPDGDAPLRRVKAYMFHARAAERWRDRRIFLAGDAAHLSPPFAGQGMNSGIRDAHNLAWKLAEAAHRDVPAAFLDSYEAERKPHAQAMIDLALSMGRVMMPRSRLRAALTRTGFRLLGLYKPARDYVSQMRYKPKPRFREGLLWPDEADGRDIVGRLFPQPIVEDADGVRVRLDDVLSVGSAVILFGTDPAALAAAPDFRAVADTGVTVVGITPNWINPAEAPFKIVRDASGGLSDLARTSHLDHAILLRPDRYVAIAVRFERIGALVPALSKIGAVTPAAAEAVPLARQI